jgi:hypothetical protein
MHYNYNIVTTLQCVGKFIFAKFYTTTPAHIFYTGHVRCQINFQYTQYYAFEKRNAVYVSVFLVRLFLSSTKRRLQSWTKNLFIKSVNKYEFVL